MTESFEHALAALRADLVARLPARLTEVLDAVRAARASASAPHVAAVRRLAHRLAGTAGSYGLTGVSDGLARVEQACDASAPAWDEVEAIVIGLVSRATEAAP